MTVGLDCKQPYWGVIRELCENKIEKKFPEYGNSWKSTYGSGFWDFRLQDEVNEVKEKSMLNQEGRIEELVDVINVCAMQISNLLDSRQREMIMQRLGF